MSRSAHEPEAFYSLMGGQEGCMRLARAFFRRVEGDSVLRPFYPRSLRCPTENIANFIGSLFGEETRFTPRLTQLRTFHTRFKIGQAERDRWVELMSAAIEETFDDQEVAVPLKQFFDHGATELMNCPAHPICPVEGDHPLQQGWRVVSGRETLYEAIVRGDLDFVRNSLDDGFASKEVLVIKAAENGRAEIVRFLLESGTDARKCSLRGWWGVAYPEIARMLLDAGATANAVGGERPPIIDATRGDKGEHPDRVLFLLENGADPNAALPNGQTALHYAARAGSLKVIELLLRFGARRDARDKKGLKPLDYAILGKKTEAARRLQAF